MPLRLRAFLFEPMVTLKDKSFLPFISAETIQERLEVLGKDISKDYEGRTPVIIGILNGSFMFLSDLVKYINCPIEVSFIRISSYQGTDSSGKVKSILGLNTPLVDRDVLIVEDIVDTGLSMMSVLDELKALKPNSIKIATLLVKPEALKHEVKCDYVGFEIPNKFVVGYGLDYDGLGRNLPEIYQLK